METKNVSGVPEGEEQNGELEFRQRQFFREGQTSVEVLTTSRERVQLIDASRTLLGAFENMSLHPDGTQSEYRFDDVIAVVENRSADMGYSYEDLVALGHIIPGTFNPETTEAIFTNPGYVFKSETVLEPGRPRKIFDGQGNPIRIEVEEVPVQKFFVGFPQQREGLKQTLYEVQGEMTAREDLVKMLRWVWNQTENLEGLVDFYFKGSLTAEAMKLLTNAEGRKGKTSKDGSIEKFWSALTKTEGGVEYRPGHEFGDATSVALKCFEIAALSEKPEEFEALLKRPGIGEIFDVTDREIDDLFLLPNQRIGQDGKAREIKPVLKTWIGEPWKWKKEIRTGKGDLEGAISKLNEKSMSEEREKASRGLLTERGNILVGSEWEDVEFIFEQIDRMLGGGKGSKSLVKRDAAEARFVAWGLLRTTAMASEYGGQPYNVECVDGIKRVVIHHEMGAMTSCDRIKVLYPDTYAYIYRYIKPEVRHYGPDGSIKDLPASNEETLDQYKKRRAENDDYPPRFTIHYFKSWNGKTPYGKRTFQEMRWGYRKGVEKDLLTDKDVELPEEVGPDGKGYRLGELPWLALSPKAYNAAALGPFIAGRKEVGLFQMRTRTNWKIDELKDDTHWKKLAANCGIAMNFQTVFDGRGRGVYSGDSDHDGQVQKKVKEEIRNYKKRFLRAFWRGLRSLPQWREWLEASNKDVVDNTESGKGDTVSSFGRIKYRLGRVGLLTPEEAKALPTDALNVDSLA